MCESQCQMSVYKKLAEHLDYEFHEFVFVLVLLVCFVENSFAIIHFVA